MYEVIPSSLSKNILILITMFYINLMLMILILLMIHKRFAVSTILLSLFMFRKEICAQNQSGDFDLLKFVYIIGKLFFHCISNIIDHEHEKKFQIFEGKRISINSTNSCFILETFWTCFFSSFSSFNNKKS